MAEPVRLENKEAFANVLKNYRMSAHALQVLRDAKLVVFSGVAGGGRNTVIKYLADHHNYHFLVSDTTRPPKLRDGMMEQDGVNYFFRSETDVLKDLEAGEFVEAEIIHNQQVSGTSIRELEVANRSGQTILHEVEFGGTRHFAEMKPDAIIIGLLPPGYDAWIARFSNREQLSLQEYTNRLETAEQVLRRMVSEPYFKLVINDAVPACAEYVRHIVETGTTDDDKQQAAMVVAHDMLARVRSELTDKRLH